MYISYIHYQWGYTDSGTINTTVNLHLSLSNEKYIISATMHNTVASNGVMNITKKSFYSITRDEDGSTVRPVYWIVFGWN